ncbi:MAG TPA: TIGR03792 family protein [Ilumatobacteraceae bacterium]|nr:TIGR03792 family protein [Ilumatobacteraceae bacterium]
MVIEFLTFRVDPTERDAWMEVEEGAWSRFLERQPGFVRKQLWIDVDDEHHVHAMIEWESLDHWKSIPADELAAVDASMGPWIREATCRTFEVIRDC